MENARRLAHLNRFRRIAFWEGLSYIALVFLAMPLKYLAGYPQAVKIVGMAHGLLFIGYVAFMLLVAWSYRWSVVRTAISFGASLIPFGTFWQETHLRKLAGEDAENRTSRAAA